MAVLLLITATALPRHIHAQSSGALAGRVIDAGSGDPVADALVSLEPAAAGLTADIDSADAVVPVRVVVTGPGGLYRFTDLAAGTYRLRIERIGYRSATVEVDVRRPVEAGVSVGLELAPVALRAVVVEQRAASLFQRASNSPDETDEARLSAELERQERFLAGDTRVLTYADVIDGVTLGGGDVFRALQRFAGVGTRDDYTAELWLRGAGWMQTRVTLDGVPLFNPVHAVGLLSAIAPEVLGSVHLHPGVRPASIGEGAAGVVDMRTRRGTGSGAVQGVADVSNVSAKLVLDQRMGTRGSWLVGGRRSHLGVLSGLDIMGLDTIDLPYVFHDLAGRIDLDVGRGVRLEASGLWEQDRLEGDVEGVLERTRARWGNTAGSTTVHVPVGSLEWSQSFGISRFDAHTDEHTVRTRETTPVWTEQASRNEIEFVRVAGTVAPRGQRQGAGWSAGYELAVQSVDYDGPFPRYHAVRPDTSMRLTYARNLTVGSLWGTVRAPLGERVAVDMGVRLETGSTIASAAVVRASPRVSLRAMLSDAHTVSVSVGRTWQHTQSIALAGPSIHPAFHATHFWLWADERTPAIRADIVNIGSERWMGAGWLASVNVFARMSDGLTLPDPTPGRLGRRPLFVRGAGAAHGAEVSVRRIGAAWSASFGYTYGVSEVEVRGARYPAAADRRHAVDAVAGVRLSRNLRVGAAFTGMSGSPFTRAYSRSPEDCTAFGFGCDDPQGSWVDAYNAERTPEQRVLDLSAEWSQAAGPLQLGVYMQLRNALARRNASTYAGSGVIGRVEGRDGPELVWDDRFERGLPRMPLAGLRIRF
ncbi:MAG TPA: TonB-dependent receptor [Longimicrobiales bacterium]|nr:TonB-dependent receptor [Longimicrobiales bacterium]